MNELGDYLKQTRESNSVGLDEAAADLKITVNVLKNVESGNTRAFRDMLELREIVKNYAKYLGLDPQKVVDEFNDFLFEHTSKIKLQDILDAEELKKNEERNVEVVSPYTKSKTKKINLKYLKMVGLVLIIVMFLIMLSLILRSILIIDNNVNTELLSSVHVEEVI